MSAKWVTLANIVRWLMGLGFLIHAVAHFVGFLVPWKLVELEDAPYRTTQLAGTVDVGDVGMKLIGSLWLATALAFAAAAAGVIAQFPWWEPLAVYAAIVSLVLSVVGWPDSRYGVFINIAILIFLLVGGEMGWLPEGAG